MEQKAKDKAGPKPQLVTGYLDATPTRKGTRVTVSVEMAKKLGSRLSPIQYVTDDTGDK